MATDCFLQRHTFWWRTGAIMVVLFICAMHSGDYRGFFNVASRLVPDACAASLSQPSNEHPIIPLEIGYEIEDADNGALRSGKLGDNCRTGDMIHLSVTTGTKCQLMVFCIDSMMVPIPVLHGQGLYTVLSDGGKIPITPFRLNKVTGTEIYYVVASQEDFSFEEITPFLDTTLSRLEKTYANGRPKGPLTNVCELRFPPKGKFSSEYIYFNHLPAPEEKTSPLMP
jgi:hypothetical protein